MNEYPTDEELEKIKNWDYKQSRSLMDYVKSLWKWPDWGFEQRDRTYCLHTGGSSGNEDIIGALRENTMFWFICWQFSKRGGHYKFAIPKENFK